MNILYLIHWTSISVLAILFMIDSQCIFKYFNQA